jgi:hypothetical protein
VSELTAKNEELETCLETTNTETHNQALNIQQLKDQAEAAKVAKKQQFDDQAKRHESVI